MLDRQRVDPGDVPGGDRLVQLLLLPGDAAAVTTAIAAGADLEHRDPSGRTPLVAATKANRVEIAADAGHSAIVTELDQHR